MSQKLTALITFIKLFPSKQYENMILMEDLNTAEIDEVLFDFIEEHFLSDLVRFPTCFKSVEKENPSPIDLIITNKHQSFQNTTSFSTGLSDFHKLVITSMKTTFPKVVPNAPVKLFCPYPPPPAQPRGQTKNLCNK